MSKSFFRQKSSDADRRGRPAVPDPRRLLVGGLAVALLLASASAWWTGWLTAAVGSESSAQFARASMARIGLVLAALALAWDSLRRPASWLPPGLAAAGVAGIAILAAQPRLILVVLPLIGVLTALAVVVKMFRGK